MSPRYRYAASLSWGGDTPTAEVEVEVEYSVEWGSSPSGHYGPPEDYDPGCPSVVEDIKLLTVEGKPRPWDMGFGFISDDAFEEMVREKLEAREDDMIAEAIAVEEARADDRADYERDRRIDDKLTGAV